MSSILLNSSGLTNEIKDGLIKQNKEDLITYITGLGWIKNKWGHYEKEAEGVLTRYRFTALSCFFEVQETVYKNQEVKKQWIPYLSGLIQGIVVTPEGKIRGMAKEG